MCAFGNDELLDRLERSLYDRALSSVKSLLLHPENVPVIIDRLKMLFGNPEVIVETMVKRIRAMPAPKADRMETIIDFGVAVQNLCATIKACQMEECLYNVALVQELVDLLPASIKMNWAIFRRSRRTVSLSEFSEWIGQLVDALSKVTRPSTSGRCTKQLDRRNRKEDAFLNTHTEDVESGRDQNRQSMCNACDKGCPTLDKCERFLEMDAETRFKIIKDKKLCKKCLKRHFKACEVNTPCPKNGCPYLHHHLLHDDQRHSQQNVPSGAMNSLNTFMPSCNTHHCCLGTVLLKYVKVTLHGKAGPITTYAFLDDGSTCSLMEHSLYEELGISGDRFPLCINWTSGQARYESNSVKCGIQLSGGRGDRKFSCTVHTVESLQLPPQSVLMNDISEHYSYLKGLPVDSYEHVQPRLILGMDNIRLGHPLDSREGQENQPAAALTRLGWIIYGPCSVSDGSNENGCKDTYSYHICQCEALHTSMKEYFSLDSLGIQTTTKALMSRDDERAFELLKSGTVQRGMRYESALLWKFENVQLPDSKPMAVKRFRCLEKRMDREPELAVALRAKIHDYELKGYVSKLSTEEEQTPRNRIWYLPIFPVTNPNKPNKLRIVWDAAAKAHGVSLNTFLLKGPDQLRSLPSILQRFREHRVAVSGDIREMYHQVLTNEEDTHCQRFLWKADPEDSSPSVYVMNVMTFGATCSPSCAQYVKNHNAERFAQEMPEAVNAIINDHYVDDMLSSVENEDEAVRLATNVRYIHAQAGFEIRGWLSNSKAVLDAMRSPSSSEKDLNVVSEVSTEKILGMWWNTSTDTFTFKLPSRLNQQIFSGQRVPTKRELLRVLMTTFDPLGFLANVLMYLKVLLQEVWRNGTGWDEPIADELFTKWRAWLAVLSKVETVSIPRCYRIRTSSSKESNRVQLHIFVDASESGFAAVGYFRYEEAGTIECAFVTAKTRVAPLRFVSIPRLELQAAVIGARLAKSIVEQHRITVHERFFWTDSRDVICWLNSDHRRYSQFVAFRAGEILESTELSEWHWLPTKLNVADEGTKWQRQPDLSPSSRWFRGPSFIWEPQSEWPTVRQHGGTTSEELKRMVCVHQPKQAVVNFENFSSWNRLLRSVAYVLRFVGNIEAKIKGGLPSAGILTSEELEEAQRYIYKQAQEAAYAEEIAIVSKATSSKLGRYKLPKESSLKGLSLYVDEHGLLRMRGRGQLCAYAGPYASNTILLPRDHHITALLVRSYHIRYHHLNHETVVNELLQNYRIPRLRRLCYSIRTQCQKCMNNKAHPEAPMMADLPLARLAVFCQPFSYTGVDYFGPMNVVVGRHVEKRWGVLFVCMTVRAIHIEIAYTLNTDSCIMAIRNFMARRGTPLQFFSDRGTNFVGANRELQEAIQEINHDEVLGKIISPELKWSFNPPSSPHMGGSWERLVQSVKRVLHRMSLPRLPTDEVLRNTFAEIENTVNSRPLTYIPIDDENAPALTPNHFLVGSSSGSKPMVCFGNSSATLRNNWKTSQVYANHFWNRWIREYLPTICRRTKWHQPTKPIQVGDIVVIVDQDLPRNMWLKGRVVATRNRDGQVRSVTVQTSQGVYDRPAVKIAVLDVGANVSKQDAGSSVLGGNVAPFCDVAPPVGT